MKIIDPAQEALLKNQFRNLYYDEGMETCLQALYEIMESARIFADVLVEEQKRGRV